MEVVLLEDVKTLGKKGQIVKVNDGYARNFILPKKLGIEATPKNLNDLKLQKANEARLAAEQLAAARELAEKLGKSSITVSIKAGEGGKAFGSVSSKEIDLVSDGFEKQILISGDMARKSYYRHYGYGPGLGYVFEVFKDQFLELADRRNFDGQALFHKFFYDNPQKCMEFKKQKSG